MKAAPIQGKAGDKLFKQRLAEKIQIDTFFLFSAVLRAKNLKEGKREGGKKKVL